MTQINLDDEDEARLDSVAEMIADGNRSEAVRKMLALFDSGETLTKTAREVDPAETSENDGIDGHLEDAERLEDYKALAQRTDSTEVKTKVLAEYLESIAVYEADRSELVGYAKEVLGCHRTTAYDYVDRLMGVDDWHKTPTGRISMEQVLDAYENEPDLAGEYSQTEVHKIKTADDLRDIYGNDLPAEYGSYPWSVGSSKFWSTFEDEAKDRRLDYAVIYVAVEEFGESLSDYRERVEAEKQAV